MKRGSQPKEKAAQAHNNMRQVAMDKSSEHLNLSLELIRPIFELARLKIEALKPGEKIPATKLAEEVAKEIDMECAQIYTMLSLFFFKNYPGVDVKRGRFGGISRPLKSNED